MAKAEAAHVSQRSDQLAVVLGRSRLKRDLLLGARMGAGTLKECESRDPTIREKFNAYRLADYKEHVIDLLRRVCTVSVETMSIIAQRPK